MSATMETAQDEALDAFRGEVRQWIADNFPASLKNNPVSLSSLEGPGNLTPDQEAWKKAMGEKGWGTPTWPAEYGGGGLSRAQAKVLNEEIHAAGAYNPIGGMGVMMLGPTLLEFANEEQKKTHVPPICRGEIRWCQGYSEPGAGSDLAALKTKCEDKGDHFLVNGQKTWTSGGQWADWCFALVRTDSTVKHAGISFILLDMKTPGVEVRPIQLISGMSPFCETFFTDVKVPKENLVGELNNGWTIGKRLLEHERTNLSGGSRLGGFGEPLASIAKRYLPADGNGQIADKDLRTRIIRHDMEARSFMFTAQRVMESAKAGGPTTISSILKNVGTKLGQDRAELIIEIMGMRGLGWEGDNFLENELEATRSWLWGKATSIYGGTAEIQNNVIAKRILGMLDHQ